MASPPGLAQMWDDSAAVRARARSGAQITLWIKPELVGIPSTRACILNATPLTIIGTWWTQQKSEAQTIPIGTLRDQAWCCQKFL